MVLAQNCQSYISNRCMFQTEIHILVYFGESSCTLVQPFVSLGLWY